MRGLRNSYYMNYLVVVWILLLSSHMARLENEDENRSEEEGPYFETDNSTLITNLTVHSGTDFVLLNCPVCNLAKNSVSWMKVDEKGNFKLLTVDQVIYSTDSKYSLEFIHPNNFQLKLNKLSIGTSGEYQCQISSHPPKLLRYYLNVVAPTIEIVDDGDKPLKDKIFKTDSTLELRCKIFFCCFSSSTREQFRIESHSSPSPPQHVSWYHDSRLLNNDTYRGGISVKSEVRRNDFAVSKLYVANVNKNDSGFYTCAMAKFGKATVLVSVLNGEIPAAMQASGHATYLQPLTNSALLVPLIIFIVKKLFRAL